MLRLVGGLVADTDGRGAAPPGHTRHLALVGHVVAVDGHDRVARHVTIPSTSRRRRGTAPPRRDGRARGDGDGQRRVPEPAVAVVPLPIAAHDLGQRRRRRIAMTAPVGRYVHPSRTDSAPHALSGCCSEDRTGMGALGRPLTVVKPGDELVEGDHPVRASDAREPLPHVVRRDDVAHEPSRVWLRRHAEERRGTSPADALVAAPAGERLVEAAHDELMRHHDTGCRASGRGERARPHRRSERCRRDTRSVPRWSARSS